ncbi:MAG: hypothetical protein EZS26_002622 [Candidatus Ordinivivax streblomastigis]|uniref:Alpha-galactosidase n=1 Tax=Candidatus Ordinivivax streblomastigis TaxID=2540710 RepID=A0A5M8NWX7_9BACT|nr:MAG: hypothetical protein EZS26_002622 [Candidatus Ordinivivax streblomastigis]
MKNYKKYSLLGLIIWASSFSFAADFSIRESGWTIQYKTDSKSLDYTYQGKTILLNVRPEASYTLSGSNFEVNSSSFQNASLAKKSSNDNFGSGVVYTIKFTNPGAAVSLEEDFFFYNTYPYLISELRLVSTTEIASNYLAPFVSTTPVAFLDGNAADNRMLLVPWDNDGFVRYACSKLNTELTSYEVTGIYNGDTRNGLVVGSISHDTWKTGISIKASGNNTVERIKCYSGVSSDLTRDKIPHGKVKGKIIRSAKMFLGYFDDWRVGMETFGYANTLIVPALTTWKRGTPIGWNSWGVLMEKIDYTNLTEVATFLKNELYDQGYHNEQGNVIIDLDSFWAEGLPTDDLRKQFATDCKQRGQIPGIYWGPFANWGGIDNSVEFTDNQYNFRECTIYANGVAQTLDGAYCLDPTHPAVKDRITKMFAQFKDWGYEYVKLDFVNFAAVQADSYYDKSVTTAIQAYNQGFQYLLDAAGDMFISLSIAPMFPYQYGNSRRMSCDAWGTIGHTEYVMNALSYGWWTDQFYQFNDPDHVVLQREGESEGANRARITSAAITGMLLMGDNFSTSYTERGNPTLSKARAIKLATNEGILDIARMGTSFMPVYGHKMAESTKAENLFMRHTDAYLYVACINYYSAIQSVSGSIPLDQLGITAEEIETIEELWTGETRTLKNGEFTYAVSSCDARVYRIKKKTSSLSLISLDKGEKSLVVSAKDGILTIKSQQPLNKVEIYSLQGQCLTSDSFAPTSEINREVPSFNHGVFVVKCYSDTQGTIVKKISI